MCPLSDLVLERTLHLPPHPAANGHDANYRVTVLAPKRQFWTYLVHRWWVALACLVLTLGAVLVYETVRSPRFESFAQLYLSAEVQPNPNSLVPEESPNYFGTQIELLKSPRLQGAAYEKVGITLVPDEDPPVKFEVVQPLKTSILQLQASAIDPTQSQQYLQALIAEYLAYKSDTRRSSMEDMVISLTDQVGRREKALKLVQDRWVEFQRTNNLAVLEEEGRSAGLYLTELNLQLAKLKLELELLRQGLAPASAGGTNAAAPPATTTPAQVPADVALRSARLELALLLGEREERARTLGDLHPTVKKLLQDAGRLEKTVAILEEQHQSQRRQDLEDLEERVASMEAAIPAWETKLRDVNERLSESQRFKNDIQREQNHYDHLSATLRGIDLNKSLQQERLSVLQPATTARPEKRHLPLRLAVAAFAGLLLTLGIVFAWHLADDRFVSLQDLEDHFGGLVLGLMPKARRRERWGGLLLAVEDRRCAFLEAFRHLRSALLLSHTGEIRPRVLLMTGTGPCEGRSTIAANLARVLAQSGFRVLLVDADPGATGLSQVPHGDARPGLLDYLDGKGEALALLRPTEVPGLMLVACGGGERVGEALFLRPKLTELMAAWRREHDFVIVDAPPLLADDNAALLVPHADLVLVVVRPFLSRAGVAHRTVDMLYQRQAKAVGFVLNHASKDDLAAYAGKNRTTPGRRKNTSKSPAASQPAPQPHAMPVPPGEGVARRPSISASEE